MNYINLLAAIILSVGCSAQTIQQEKNAHQAIKTFVSEKYPGAKSKLIIEEYRSYRVMFKLNGHKYTSSFSIKGGWIQTAKELKLQEISDSLRQSFNTSKYANAKICSVTEITSLQNPAKVYIVKVRLDKHDPENDTWETVVTETHKLYFSDSGRMTKDELEPDNSLPYIPWGGD